MAYRSRSRGSARRTVSRGRTGGRRPARRASVSRRRSSRSSAGPRTLKIVVETTAPTPARDFTGLMTMAQSSTTKRKGKF